MGLYSDYIFPAFFDSVVGHKIYNKFRGEVLRQARGRILEIGIGTGLNLDLYPKTVNEIYAIDPNPGMERQLRKKLETRRIKVNFTLAGAESLPYPAGYFDTVVSTLTLCSIPDLPRALAEVRRVLKHGGKFLFLDHGLSREPRVARFQNYLNPLQHKIGCGCSLTVDVERVLRAADFHIDQLKLYYAPRAPKFIGQLYEGIAHV